MIATLRRAFLRTLGHQLGAPSGLLGAVVAPVLNRGNAPTITAAVDVLADTDPGPDTPVADIGFGGGLGLDLLLRRLPGPVHGIEPSGDMLARARRHHSGQVDADRLHLHHATMEALPFADGALGGWMSLNTIYFVDDLAPAFAELTRVLVPTGTGVLGIADPTWLAARPFAGHGFIVRPVAEVVAALVDAGLDVERRQLTGSRTTSGSAPFNLLVCRRSGS